MRSATGALVLLLALGVASSARAQGCDRYRRVDDILTVARSLDDAGDYPAALHAYECHLEEVGTVSSAVRVRITELRAWMAAGGAVTPPDPAPAATQPERDEATQSAAFVLMAVGVLGTMVSYIGALAALYAEIGRAAPMDHLGWLAVPWVGPWLVFTGGDNVTEGDAVTAVVAGLGQGLSLALAMLSIVLLRDASGPANSNARVELAPRAEGAELRLTLLY